jgi:creatinine amidohydrolase
VALSGVKLADRNWMQVEEYLTGDDRIVLPVGSTEQHAYLSLATDSILAERLAVEAAEPSGVLVLPVMPFGIAPGFATFPGTVTLRPETLAAVLTEALETLYGQGFRGFLLVNGHGGNLPVQEPVETWAGERSGARLVFHSWWDTLAVRDAATTVYSGDATHASWFESFPWTRLAAEVPAGEKPMVTDREALRELEPAAVRAAIGDGSYGGPYQVPDDQVLRVWEAGVTETRALIEAL